MNQATVVETVVRHDEQIKDLDERVNSMASTLTWILRFGIATLVGVAVNLVKK